MLKHKLLRTKTIYNKNIVKVNFVQTLEIIKLFAFNF